MNKNTFLKKIKQHFPQIIFKRSRMLTHGWDNVAIILDNAYIFRFPREKQNEQFKRELALNPLLVKRITSVPIPHYTLVSKDRSFVGYNLIQGSSVPPKQFRKFASAQKNEIARQLAEFLRELHRFPVATARKCGIVDAWSSKEAKKSYDKELAQVCKKLSAKELKTRHEGVNILAQAIVRVSKNTQSQQEYNDYIKALLASYGPKKEGEEYSLTFENFSGVKNVLHLQSTNTKELPAYADSYAAIKNGYLYVVAYQSTDDNYTDDVVLFNQVLKSYKIN